MTFELNQALAIIQPLAVAYFIVFLRVGAAMAFLPAFGEAMVPGRVKLVIALSLTALVAPSVEIDRVNALGWLANPFVPLAEIAVGLTIGLALRLVVIALQIAGAVAAQSTSLAQLFGGEAVDPQPALGAVLVLGGLALATTLGLHTKIVAALTQTYVVFPVGDPFPTSSIAVWLTMAVSAAFKLAIVLSAPFLIISLLYNLALGVVNRAMPQLMVAFVGAPAITFGALVLLALTAPITLMVWSTALEFRLINPLGLDHVR